MQNIFISAFAHQTGMQKHRTIPDLWAGGSAIGMRNSMLVLKPPNEDLHPTNQGQTPAKGYVFGSMNADGKPNQAVQLKTPHALVPAQQLKFRFVSGKFCVEAVQGALPVKVFAPGMQFAQQVQVAPIPQTQPMELVNGSQVVVWDADILRFPPRNPMFPPQPGVNFGAELFVFTVQIVEVQPAAPAVAATQQSSETTE